MKVLLLSDIHANMDALQAVLDQEKTFDAVWFAGDLVDYGLQPHEVIAWAKEVTAVTVAGNHDIGIVNRFDNGFVKTTDPFAASSFSEYNLNVMTEDDIEYLRAMPKAATFTAFDTTYHMTHVYDDTDDEMLLKQMQGYSVTGALNAYWEKNVGKTTGKRCLILGHTHRCAAFQPMPDFLVLNPGSVSYHLGADTLTAGVDYMVIIDGVPFMRHAAYDPSESYQKICDSAFGQWEKDTGKNIFSPYKQ